MPSPLAVVPKIMPKIAAAIVAALIGSLLPALPAQAANGAPVVTDVTTSHPRLMKNGAGFASLTSRVSTDPVSRDLYATVVKKADGMLGASVVTYSKPDGARLLDTSRTVLDRSYTLLVAWKVSGKAKYIDRLQRDLDAAASFPNWNPDHFLDTAEMTHAFAISYDWGYSHWSSAERNKLRQAILNKGLAPSLKVYDATSVDATPYKYGGNWAMRSDNVNIVTNSALAMGALAVARDTSSPLPQQILDKSVASLRVGLRAYGPDGGFEEGPTYWEYATRYLTSFLASLKTSTGSVYGLTSASGLSQTASFMQAMTGPGGQYYGFGDSITAFQPAAAYAGLGSVFGDGSRMALAASVKSSAYAPLQLVLRDPGLAGRSTASASAALQNTFTAAGVTSMTGARTDRRASYAAFRFGADPAASHQHFDGGDFGYQALGQEWAVDLGMESGTYDLLAENRATARWNYYRTRAEGHNTLAIDPFDPDAGNKTSVTKLIKKGSDVDSAYAVADLSSAYAGKVSSWHRGVRLFDNRSQLLVQDEIAASGSIEALWSMHTGARIQVASDGRSAVLFQNGERVLARIVSPGGQTFVPMAAAPLPTSPSVKQTSNTGISKLAIVVKGSQKVTVAVQLTPLRHGSTVQGAPGPVVPTALARGTSPAPPRRSPASRSTARGSPASGPTSRPTPSPSPAAGYPVVSATAPAGKVAVQQATSVPGRATITVSGTGGAATRYVVYLEAARLTITKASASVVSSGYASATIDGNKKTYWGANASTATVTWELARPTDVDSAVFSWRANSAKKVVFEVATSTDKKTWVQRYAGQYVGGSSDQAVRLSSGSASRYVRLTVHGDRASVKTSMLDEVRLLDYDVRSDYSSTSASRPTAVAVKGVPATMTTGQLALAAPKATWTGSAGKATYRYVSSNPAAATVDGNGLVTAKNGGKAQIGVLATSAGTTVTTSVPVAVADTTKVRLYATADTYVQSSTPGTSYGKQYGMQVKPSLSGSTSANRVGYLRFDVSKLAGKTVSSAVLNTESVITDNTTSPSTERIDLRAAGGSWSESSLTYASRPTLGSTVGSFVAGRTKKRTTANVSAYVASAAKNKKSDLTVGLTQEAVRPALLTTVSSKESGAGAYLDVTLTPPPLKVRSAVASATTSGSVAATFDGDASTAWRVDKNPGWVRWELASPAHVASTRCRGRRTARRRRSSRSRPPTTRGPGRAATPASTSATPASRPSRWRPGSASGTSASSSTATAARSRRRCSTT